MDENVKNDKNKSSKKAKAIFIIICIIIYTIVVAKITIDIYKEIDKKDLNKINISTTTNNNDDNIFINQKEENVNEAVKLNLKDTVSKEGKYELTVLGHNIAKKILPPNTSGYYTYYEAKEEGHKYLEIKCNYKNLEAEGVRADKVASIKIKYADKYEYTGFSAIEDSDNDFTYTNITEIAPLTVGKLHYLFDIPDEVANGTESIVATITVGEDIYEVKIR